MRAKTFSFPSKINIYHLSLLFWTIFTLSGIILKPLGAPGLCCPYYFGRPQLLKWWYSYGPPVKGPKNTASGWRHRTRECAFGIEGPVDHVSEMFVEEKVPGWYELRPRENNPWSQALWQPVGQGVGELREGLGSLPLTAPEAHVWRAICQI